MHRTTLRLLRLHRDANAGHIGGNLSALDAMVYLHAGKMTESDLFVLSKGHSAGALYLSLWASGKIDEELLESYAKDGTFLSAHPAANWHSGIPFMTGSLGHGISLAAGVALGWKRQGKSGRVFCLMSDGELQEGSCWEAFVFAAHNSLDNLTIAVDHNGLQGFGTVLEVAAPMLPLAEKFSSFGLTCSTIDGHSFSDLVSAFSDHPDAPPVPRVIIMRTEKGHGISFMRGRMDSHYLPFTEEQYRMAVKEVNQRYSA